MGSWVNLFRPGFFGRNRDKIFAELNEEYGEGKWRLVWYAPDLNYEDLEYKEACKYYYEESYYQFLRERHDLVNQIIQYNECYDNAISNIKSGLDYTIQEAYSTHIQDIAIRNVLKRLHVWFKPEGLGLPNLLQIRHQGGLGSILGPGNVPFWNPCRIEQPSKRPSWANKDSVEDFWQSNKYVQVWVEDLFV